MLGDISISLELCVHPYSLAISLKQNCIYRNNVWRPRCNQISPGSEKVIAKMNDKKRILSKGPIYCVDIKNAKETSLSQHK